MDAPRPRAPASRPIGNGDIKIGEFSVAPGERASIDLPVTDLYTHTAMTMPVEVINGRAPGPTLFVCAAIHGDEINGVEIVRRLLAMKALRRLRGALIAIPIVNVLGFLNLSRYLPDRRDLNRSFPGSERGSAASRLANIFCEEIVQQAHCGIDLHTGAVHRSNLPQIRAQLSDPETARLARAFGVPVLIDAAEREGSLRAQANRLGIPLLVYEAGEALRFDDVSIRGGVQGVTRVMRALGMLPDTKKPPPKLKSVVALDSAWVRAPHSGIVRSAVRLGAYVSEGQPIARISDPFGSTDITVRSPYTGIVIGLSKLPLAHEGDAICHIAEFEQSRSAEAAVAAFQEQQAPTAG